MRKRYYLVKVQDDGFSIFVKTKREEVAQKLKRELGAYEVGFFYFLFLKLLSKFS